MKKKVLFVGPVPPAVGGVAAFMELLLASSLDAEYELGCFDVLAEEFRGGKNAARGLWRKALMYARFVIRAHSHGADLVHINASSHQSFWFSSFFLLLAKYLCRKKVIMRIGGGEFERFYEDHPLRGLIRFFLRRPDALIVQSTRWKDFFHNRAGAARARVLPNGVDNKAFDAVPAARGISGVSGGKILVFIGYCPFFVAN